MECKRDYNIINKETIDYEERMRELLYRNKNHTDVGKMIKNLWEMRSIIELQKKNIINNPQASSQATVPYLNPPLCGQVTVPINNPPPCGQVTVPTKNPPPSGQVTVPIKNHPPCVQVTVPR